MLSNNRYSAQALDQLPLPVLLPIILEYIRRARIKEMEREERQKQRQRKSRILKRVTPKTPVKENRQKDTTRKGKKPSLLARISKFFGLMSPILSVSLAIYHFFAPAPSPSITVVPVYKEQEDSTDYLFNQKRLEKLLQYLEPLLLRMNHVIGDAVTALNSGESQSLIKARIIEHLNIIKEECETDSTLSLTAQLEQKRMAERTDVLIAVLKMA